MAKNVALSEKAYKKLSVLKGNEESFSDVVLRLSGGHEPVPLRRFFGILKDDKEIGRIYEKILRDRHKKMPRKVRFDDDSG